MDIGVQYYPEHWPRERWPVDAQMMQRAGITTVRMGEFAWSAYERQEGQIDFSWMEEAIALLGRHGIRTILCTCSRTPPPWIYAKYPGVLTVDKNGIPFPTDQRYRVAMAHDEFIRQSQRIDRAIVSRFAGCDDIIAWQIDNEIGSCNDCYCPRCRTAFQAYLKETYGSIDAVNEAWGAHFWSFAFSDFSEVPVGVSQPQLVLAYRRFLSHLNKEFARWRSDLIHKLDPGKPVTTNFQNLYAYHTDCHDVAGVIDISSMNNYPLRTPELALDYYRGKRETLWALEQHTHLQHLDTPDGLMRLWAWMAVGHGADTVVYFRWRQCRWGAEQFNDGIMPHSGDENRLYRELCRIGKEARQLTGMISGTRPWASVAVTYSYESRWSVLAANFGPDADPLYEASDYHKALTRRVTAIDAMDPREDFSGYKLVIAPRLWMMDAVVAANLGQYVENGGTLCLTAGSGVVDEYGKSFDTPRPGFLRDMAGITVRDLGYEDGLQFRLESDTVPALNGARGYLMADEIHPEGATAIAVHAAGWRKGRPAVTSHTFGKGRVIYVGLKLVQTAIDGLVDWLCETSGIPRPFEWPEKVNAYERACKAYRLLFLINYNDDKRIVNVGEGWCDVFSGKSDRQVEIPAVDLRILRAEIHH